MLTYILLFLTLELLVKKLESKRVHYNARRLERFFFCEKEIRKMFKEKTH
jgi:hypothetical protein